MTIIMWGKITVKNKMRKWINVKGLLAQCLYILCYYKTKKAKANKYPEGKKHTKMLLFLYRHTYIDTSVYNFTILFTWYKNLTDFKK